MRTALVFISVLGLLLSTASCAKRTVAERPIVPGDFVTLEVGGEQIHAALAFDRLSRRKGLMGVESLPENQGMLFLHESKAEQSFWMKNTLIPLSIAFIDDDGVILQIEDMKPKDLRSIRSKDPVRYALEMNQGWFERNGVHVQDRLDGFAEKVRRIPVQ